MAIILRPLNPQDEQTQAQVPSQVPGPVPRPPRVGEERGVIGHATDIAGGIAGGVRDAVQETIDFGFDAADWIDNQAGDHMDIEVPDWLQLPNWETDTTAGKLARGVSQFAAGFIGAGKFLHAAKLVQGASKGATLARGMVQGAIADTVVFDPHEGRLSNLVQEFPALENPVTNYLAADPNDSAAEGRFKNALEGLLVGGATEVLFKAVRGLKKAKVAHEVGGEEAAAKSLAESETEIIEAAQNPRNPKESAIEVSDELRLAQEGQEKMGSEAPSVDVEGFRAALKDAKDKGYNLIDSQQMPKVFNHRRIEGDEEIKTSIFALADNMTDDELLAFTGRQSHKEVLEEGVKWHSEMTGESSQNLLKALAGDAQSMEQQAKRLVAGRIHMQSMAKQVKQLADKVAMNPTAADEAELVKLVEQMAHYEKVVKMIQTSAARTTASGRIVPPWNVLRSENVDVLNETIEKMGGSAKVRDFARKLAMTNGDPKALYKTATEGWKGKTLEVVTEYWINAILSGMKTHVVNITSGLVKTGITPGEMMIGGALSGQKDMIRQGGRMYAGLFRYFTDSIRMAGKVVKMPEAMNMLDPMHTVADVPTTAINAHTFGVADKGVLGTGVDFMGRILRLPSRMLMTGDEFLKQLNYRSALYAQLYDEGFKKGFKDKELAEFVEANFDKYFDKFTYKSRKGTQTVQQAVGTAKEPLQYAREVTWTKDLEYGISKSLQGVTARHPMARLVLPFIRTPVNLARDFWAHTPLLNRLQTQYRADLAAGGQRAALAKGKNAVGTLFWGTAGMLAMSGNLTGGGPKNPDQRALLYETGWQPYSVKVGDKYYQFSRTDPFGMFLGIAADFAEISGHLKDEEAANLGAMMLTALSKNIMSKTYLKGLVDTLNAITDPEMNAEKYIQRQVASFVPFSGFLGQIRQTTDPELREVATILDAIKNKIPGFSETLPARRSWITGKPIEYSPGWGPDMASPIPVSQDKKDIVFDELRRLSEHKAFAPPTDSVYGVKLEPAQYERLNEIHGTLRLGRYTMHQRLERLFRSEKYDISRRMFGDGPLDMNDSPRLKAVEKVIRTYRKAAVRQLLREDRQLLMTVEEQRRRDRMVRRGQGNAVEQLATLKLVS